jgi:hypothetical protein
MFASVARRSTCSRWNLATSTSGCEDVFFFHRTTKSCPLTCRWLRQSTRRDMRLDVFCASLSALTAATAAFNLAGVVHHRRSTTTTTTRWAALLDTDAAAPVKTAPGAGWEPEWENRPGLSPEKFMESDLSKPDISGMWECPLTRWDSDG